MAVSGYVAPNPSKNVLIPHGVKLLFKRTGTTHFINLGDLSDVSVTPAAEYFEYNTNHTGQSTLGKKLLTNRALTIDATLNEITNENLRLAFLGDEATDQPVLSTSSFNPTVVETITLAALANTFNMAEAAVEIERITSPDGGTEYYPLVGGTGATANGLTISGTATSEDTLVTIGAGVLETAVDAAGLDIVVTYKIPFQASKSGLDATTPQVTEILSKSTATGEAQFQIRNNEGGFAQVYVIDDVTLAPNGAMATPADGVQTLPVQLTAQIKDGKFGRIYTANV